jgi:hypothetical protein
VSNTVAAPWTLVASAGLPKLQCRDGLEVEKFVVWLQSAALVDFDSKFRGSHALLNESILGWPCDE